MVLLSRLSRASSRIVAIVAAVAGAAQFFVGEYYKRRVDDYAALTVFERRVDSVASAGATWQARCAIANVGFSRTFPSFTVRIAYPSTIATEPPAQISADVAAPPAVRVVTVPAPDRTYLTTKVDSGLAPHQAIVLTTIAPRPAGYEFSCNPMGRALRDSRTVERPLGWDFLDIAAQHVPYAWWTFAGICALICLVFTATTVKKPSASTNTRYAPE